MIRLACSVAAVALLAACQQPAPTAEAPAPVAAATAPTPVNLSPEQSEAAAFQAAWGAPPPVTSKPTDADASPITYSKATLVPMGGDRYALISSGKGGESHAESGALAIHYLKRTTTGFERISAWPEFILGGTFGAPPEWTVRNDLTPAPALLTQGSGTWQGYTCAWSNVVELTPDRPIIRTETFPVSYDSGGAAMDDKDAQKMEGAVVPGEKGRTFVVRYTGDLKADVTYRLDKGRYVATTDPDLLTC